MLRIIDVIICIIPWFRTFSYIYLSFCSRGSINSHIIIKCTFCSIWYTCNISLISYNFYFISSSCWTSKGRSMIGSSALLRSVHMDGLIIRLSDSNCSSSFCSRSSINSHITIKYTFCSIWCTSYIITSSYNLYFVGSPYRASKGGGMISSSTLLRCIYMYSLIISLNYSNRDIGICSRTIIFKFNSYIASKFTSRRCIKTIIVSRSTISSIIQ